MKTKIILSICGLGLLMVAAACSFHPLPHEDYARCEADGTCHNPECTCTTTGVCLPPDDADPTFCRCPDEEGFAHHERFEINLDMVPRGELDNFPLLVSVTLPAGQDIMYPNLQDLVFLIPDGLCKIHMPYEIEHYDRATRKLFAWVRFPSLNTTIEEKHTFYMYWGSPYTEDQSHPDDVWSDDVLMVHHMGEMRTGFFLDSSGGEHHATPHTSGQPMTPSIIHQGVSFDGENTQLLEIEHDPVFDLNSDLTIEALVKVPGSVLEQNSDGGEWQIISHHTHYPGSGYVLLLIRDPNQTLLELRTYVDCPECSPHPSKTWNLRQPVDGFMVPGSWHHLVGKMDAEGLHIFVDGHKIGSKSIQQGAAPPSIHYEENLPVRIGASAYGDTVDGHLRLFLFDGDIDEVRIHRVARSDAWIEAQANNLLHPETFFVCDDCAIEE